MPQISSIAPSLMWMSGRCGRKSLPTKTEMRMKSSMIFSSE